MQLKRYALVLAAVLLVAGGGLAFAATNTPPSAQDILTRSAATLLDAKDGHAVLDFSGSGSGKSGAATVEVWGKKLAAGDPPVYAVRAEVRQSSDQRAVGALAVSDGQQAWFYAPALNTVWTASVEQMRQQHSGAAFAFGTPDALVQQLLQYASATLLGSETAQGHSAFKLQLTPLAGGSAAAVAGASGLLWIDSARWLPLQATLDAGSMGQATIAASDIRIDQGVDDSLFHFQPPAGATIVPLASQTPQHLTLDSADAAAGFHVLRPGYLPAGATLIDVTKVGDAVILHYEAASGAIAIAQNIPAARAATSGAGEQVSLRGSNGALVTAAAGNQSLLIWTENGRTYSIGGVLAGDEAVRIAQSLQ